MKINVPAISQPKNSNDCGVASLAMILKYYKITFSYPQIKKDLKVFNEGTYAPQLGLYLLNKGFEVSIVTQHPGIFRVGSKFKDSSDLISHFKLLKSKLKGKINQLALKFFIDFVSAGGMVIPEIPNAKIMKSEISQKRPMIALLTSMFLTKSKLPTRFNLHFNIVTGIDKDYIYANDPASNPLYGGKRKHKIESYLYAIHASAYPCIDNASLILIKKK